MTNRHTPPLEEQLAETRLLHNATLCEAWAALFGAPPPPTIGRRLLELAAAYQAQAKVHGGVSAASRRKLLTLARQKTWAAETKRDRKPRGALTPGSRLVREWHGRSHTVEVTDAGFVYAGRPYKSLSEVARAITGARWSGPRFFGL
jgi:hypothetical protein